MTTAPLVARDAERELGRLYRRHYDHLVNYAGRMVDAEDAVDVVQDAFVKLFDHVQRAGLPGPSRERALIFRIVHDCALDHQRRSLVKGRVMQLVSGATAAIRRWATTERRHDDAEIATHLDRAIGALRPSWQQVLRLVAQQQLEVHEVAETLGIKESTVRAHLVRATDALQQQLTQAGMTPARLQRRPS